MILRRLVLALALLAAGVTPAWAAAPVFDAASAPTPPLDWTVGSASVTWSHTVSAAGNPVICVGVLSAAGSTVTSVTYNAVGLTQAWTKVYGAVFRNDFWCLLNPATGAHNVVVTFSASTGYAINARSYTGVGALGTAATPTSGTGATPSVNVTSAVGDLVVDNMTGNQTLGGAGPSVGAGQTQRYNNYDVGTGRANAGSDEAGAATVTMSWTLDSAADVWGTSGLSLRPVASSSPKHRAVTEP